MEQKKIAAGVLPVCSRTGRILLVQRGPSQDGSGTWACLGGMFEDKLDHSPKETAKREFVEESRYIGNYKISSTPLFINKSNHLNFYTYVGLFTEEFIPNIEAEKEAVDFGWFHLDEIPSNLLPGFAETLNNKNKTLRNLIWFNTKNN